VYESDNTQSYFYVYFYVYLLIACIIIYSAESSSQMIEKWMQLTFSISVKKRRPRKHFTNEIKISGLGRFRF